MIRRSHAAALAVAAAALVAVGSALAPSHAAAPTLNGTVGPASPSR